MGNPRGHLRLEFTVDTRGLQLPVNEEGLEGWHLTWWAQITALTVYWVLIFFAFSGWFWVDLKTELGNLKGS